MFSVYALTAPTRPALRHSLVQNAARHARTELRQVPAQDPDLETALSVANYSLSTKTEFLSQIQKSVTHARTVSTSKRDPAAM